MRSRSRSQTDSRAGPAGGRRGALVGVDAVFPSFVVTTTMSAPQIKVKALPAGKGAASDAESNGPGAYGNEMRNRASFTDP